MKHKRVEDTLQAIQPSRLRSLGGGNCRRFRRWDSHRSGVLSSNKLLISRVAQPAKIAHSALRMYTVMYKEALATSLPGSITSELLQRRSLQILAKMLEGRRARNQQDVGRALRSCGRVAAGHADAGCAGMAAAIVYRYQYTWDASRTGGIAAGGRVRCPTKGSVPSHRRSRPWGRRREEWGAG